MHFHGVGHLADPAGASPEAAPMVTCAAMGVPNLGETLAQNPGIMCSRAAIVQMRDWPIMFTSSAVVMPTSAMAATTNLAPHGCQLGPQAPLMLPL